GDVSSCSYPYPATLDGIPGRVPSYHHLGPLQGLMASRYPGAYASLLHREGGSCTRTRLKLHEPRPVPAGRDRRHSPAERIAQKRANSPTPMPNSRTNRSAGRGPSFSAASREAKKTWAAWWEREPSL